MSDVVLIVIAVTLVFIMRSLWEVVFYLRRINAYIDFVEEQDETTD